MRATHRNDRGETLIEVLVAFVVLAIFTPALIMGIILVITSTGTFKAAIKPTNNAGLILDNWSGDIDNKPYLDCALDTWAPAAPLDPTSTTGNPTASVEYWDGSTKEFTPTCGTDSGVQLWTLTVTTQAVDSVISDQQDLKVVKRKPCLPSEPVCS